MRIVILLAIGLVLGALGSHAVDSALAARTAYPRAIMHVMHHHYVNLQQAVTRQSCRIQTTHADLQAMRHIARELGPAFGTSDPHFNHLADKLRTSLQSAAEHTPANCRQLATALPRIHDHCDACHRQYR